MTETPTTRGPSGHEGLARARSLSVGVVTDEVSRSLSGALETAASWGLTRVELREGGRARFPDFSPDEVAAVEAWRRGGGEVTAVSPGLFKGSVDDEARLRREVAEVLPRSIDLAVRLGCPTVLAFGFERAPGERPEDRRRVMEALARAAEQAAAAGLRVAVENEPAFWVDHPEDSVALLREIDHPTLGLNWDPANLHWGGRLPTRADVRTVQPYLVNVHVKDYGAGRPQAPWWPLGEGQTPWAELVGGLLLDTDLAAVTLETHCEPLVDASRASLSALRHLIADAEASLSPAR
jgi:sugar phosphate isomerase/epimerase